MCQAWRAIAMRRPASRSSAPRSAGMWSQPRPACRKSCLALRSLTSQRRSPAADTRLIHSKLTGDPSAACVAGPAVLRGQRDAPPGAKFVNAFKPLPTKGLAAPVPGERGRRVVFTSSDHADASSAVAQLSFLGLDRWAAIVMSRAEAALKIIKRYEPIPNPDC